MTRRDFVAQAAVMAAWWGLRPAAGQGAASAPLGRFVPLRGGAGYFVGRGGTIGWLANADGLLAIDTQFPDTAAEFLAGMPGRNQRPLDLVINTHHHGDHTGGNAVFREATTRILAHTHVPGLMRAAAAHRGQPAPEAAALPTETTPGNLAFDVGSERVRLDYHGPAHTKGDLVVTLERANVVHLGDLLFNRLYPVIDRPGGASIRGWIGILETLARQYGEDTRFIFGHGSAAFGVTGTRGDLYVFRDYLDGLLEHVRAQVQAGRTRDEIAQLDNLPGFPDFHAPAPNRLKSNLEAAYDELTAGVAP